LKDESGSGPTAAAAARTRSTDKPGWLIVHTAPHPQKQLFGPWSPSLADAIERRCQFRALGALAAVFLGSGHCLVAELRAAERDPIAAARAFALLGRIPTLTQRRLISVFGRVTWPPRAKQPEVPR
jgi:hypothetical protein